MIAKILPWRVACVVYNIPSLSAPSVGESVGAQSPSQLPRRASRWAGQAERDCW